MTLRLIDVLVYSTVKVGRKLRGIDILACLPQNSTAGSSPKFFMIGDCEGFFPIRCHTTELHMIAPLAINLKAKLFEDLDDICPRKALEFRHILVEVPALWLRTV